MARALCLLVARNTPTGVGKTLKMANAKQIAKKHPHGRGEDFACLRPLAAATETPPRAWGRRQQRHASQHDTGNTPTGVGKTKGRRFRDFFG